jgi:hypothetical protein
MTTMLFNAGDDIAEA